MAVRRKEYREYWCGFFRCFWCALWYNGNKFHKWTSITQIVLFVFTILAPLLPWLKISYETGNHLERVRKVFDFIDGNSNNVLEFEELSAHLKDMNFVFFGGYFRNDVEMMNALLADQSSGCLAGLAKDLQGTCALGDRAQCLQGKNWEAEGGRLMRSPAKLQRCITALMDPGYLATTGDGCVDRVVRGWLEQGNVHSCLRGTGVDIEEFALHARALVPGLGAEQAAPNHCLNASLSAYLSVYGALTLRMSLTAASDAAEPRCHAFGGRVAPKNFTCTLLLDVWRQQGWDVAVQTGLLNQEKQQCRDLAGYLIDVFEGQRREFGCDIQCTPEGKAVMSEGCVLKESVIERQNRYINAEFKPTCLRRVGTGIQGDPCPRDVACPACSYPRNSSGVVRDVTRNFNVHSGTSGMSAVYDTLCGVAENVYMKELMNTVRTERRLREATAAQKADFKATLTAQCAAKLRADDFAEGVISVTESTELMSSWPRDTSGMKHDTLSCSCQANVACEGCIAGCVDGAFSLPERWTKFETAANCSHNPKEVLRAYGSAAFKEVDGVTVWECNGAEECKDAVGQREAFYAGYPLETTHVERAGVRANIVVAQLLSRLCPVSMAIVALYVVAFLLQCLNLGWIWFAIRSSDGMSVDDAWRQERRIMWSCTATATVILLPALMYGAYVSAYGQTDKWGASHRLFVGWYLAIVVAVLSLVPFRGAWLSFLARPREWRNAMQPFRIANESDLVGVTPGHRSRRTEGKEEEEEEMRDIEEQRAAFTRGAGNAKDVRQGRAMPTLPEPKLMGMS